jgi:hypothetical protein
VAVWEDQILICAREPAFAKKPCFCLRAKRRMSYGFRGQIQEWEGPAAASPELQGDNESGLTFSNSPSSYH